MTIRFIAWEGWKPHGNSAKQSIIKRIVLHYSATYEGAALTPETVQDWHTTRKRPFNGVGYHLMINHNGDAYLGRPLHVVGAHAEPNSNSIGICYFGGLKKETGQSQGYDTRTPEQKRVIYEYIDDLLAGKYNTDKVRVDPNADVCGHYQVPGTSPTQCPGFDFRSDYAAHRRAKAGQAPVPTTHIQPPLPTAPTTTPTVTEDKVPITPTQNAGAATGCAVATGTAYLAGGTIAAIIVGVITVAGIIYFNVRGR